jgi:hypothetical protein
MVFDIADIAPIAPKPLPRHETPGCYTSAPQPTARFSRQSCNHHHERGFASAHFEIRNGTINWQRS